MLFYGPFLGIPIFSIMVCQIFGRLIDCPPDENVLDQTSQTDILTKTAERNCSCVPKHMCTSYENSINGVDKGEGPILINLLEPYCTNSEYVCCEPNAIINSWSSDSDLTQDLQPYERQKNCKCAPIEDCQLYDGLIIENTNGEGIVNPRSSNCPDPRHICCVKLRETAATKYVRKRAICGVRQEQGSGFTFSRDNAEAQFGEFPSVVIIYKKKFKGEKEFLQLNCGGSLIHLRIVLTAAHCVRSYADKPDLLIVRAGEWNTESTSEAVPHQDRVAEKIITHPMFNSGNKAYDVALVVLKEQFEFAENVDVICLPSADTEVNKDDCIAIGWGKNPFNYLITPKKLDLPIIPKADCQLMVMDSQPSVEIHESLICAGGKKGFDSVCHGDGGGPLLCPVPGRYDIFQQIGIVSWGFDCRGENPSFYTNVPMMRNWIDNEVENLGLQKSGFYELPDHD